MHARHPELYDGYTYYGYTYYGCTYYGYTLTTATLTMATLTMAVLTMAALATQHRRVGAPLRAKQPPHDGRLVVLLRACEPSDLSPTVEEEVVVLGAADVDEEADRVLPLERSHCPR